MKDDHELDPVARLRAADPAAAVEPRAGFAEEVVAKVTADAPTDATKPTTEAPVTDLGAERVRRRPRWLPVAAAAASLAVVGALGYGIGSTTAGTTNVAGGAAPPISLQGTMGAGESRSGMPEAGAPVPDQSKMSGGAAADMMYPYGFGRNAFHASGLSTSQGTATAYAFDAQAASNAETVAALAAALGVDGTPTLANGAWTVGSQDGTAPSLWVSLDGTMSFSYSNPLLNPWQCTDDATVCEQPVAGDLPSEQAAIDALRSLIVSAGRDPARFEFTSETWEGAVTRTAQAWLVVDGQRIDQAWSVELASDGMVSAYGALAQVITLGEYPVVSEQEAFERLSDPRFGAQMTSLPIALRDQPVAMPEEMVPEETVPEETVPEEWVPPTEPPATPSAGASLSWPVNDVEIVDARLGLASQWQPDGSVLIVPAYEFSDADGGTWSVIAVADEKLDFESESRDR